MKKKSFKSLDESQMKSAGGSGWQYAWWSNSWFYVATQTLSTSLVMNSGGSLVSMGVHGPGPVGPGGTGG